MANAIEKLFDTVVPSLAESKGGTWPDASEDDVATHREGLFDDRVFPVGEEEQRWTDRVDGLPIGGQVGGEEREWLEGGLRHRGMDVLAFYKTRRRLMQSPFPERWGIFYLDVGLQYLASEIAREYPGYGNPQRLGLDFLREHERFHYLADVQTLMFEATLGRHLYLPLSQALRGRRTHFVEEALANRQAWDWAKKPSIGLREFAFDFMKLQPNAYARFDEPRLDLAAEWAAGIVDSVQPGTGTRSDLAHWVEAAPKNLMRTSLCPEYVVRPVSLAAWLNPALVVPPVKQVDDEEEVAKRLESRYASLREAWQRTKTKLLENRLLRGLNFKPWPKDGPNAYSVRVNDNMRAHLRHRGAGAWSAYIIGPHKELGHG